MANRSDYNSILPRQYKKLISLQYFSDPHQRGEVRRLWIAAHAADKKARQKRLTARFDGLDDQGTITPEVVKVAEEL